MHSASAELQHGLACACYTVGSNRLGFCVPLQLRDRNGEAYLSSLGHSSAIFLAARDLSSGTALTLFSTSL